MMSSGYSPRVVRRITAGHHKNILSLNHGCARCITLCSRTPPRQSPRSLFCHSSSEASGMTIYFVRVPTPGGRGVSIAARAAPLVQRTKPRTTDDQRTTRTRIPSGAPKTTLREDPFKIGCIFKVWPAPTTRDRHQRLGLPPSFSCISRVVGIPEKTDIH